MKKRLILTAALIVISILLSSCVMISVPEKERPTPAAASKEPAVSAGILPTAEPLPSASLPHTSADAAEESCAYITGMSMRMDGETDITFDYVEWLSGSAAEQKYLEDHPGATEEDMEAEGLYEIGYIRNVNDELRTFHTTPDTKYFLPDAEDMSVNAEVGCDEFRDRMFPAARNGVDEYLKFVNVKAQGEAIISVEWLYLP